MFKLHLYIRIIRIIYLVVSILLSYWINNILFIFLSEEAAEKRLKNIHKKNAGKILTTTLSLKGVLIKIGQFMSSRVDILPVEYTDELSQLQDRIPPVEYELIRLRLESELGGSVSEFFNYFNPVPIASASLGQVHLANLKSGEQVAVKVQYPHIEKIVRYDLRAVTIACVILSFEFKHVRFDVLLKEFSKLVTNELNYLMEGKNAEKFRTLNADDPRIKSPKIHWDHTTSRVLTMEFLTGIKISDIEAMKKNNINLKAVADLLAESFLKQILVHRFFHGDPHPGNIFVENGAGSPNLIFVDFGLMQPISKEMHEGIKNTIYAIIENDMDGIVKGMLDLGIITWSKNLKDIKEVVEFFMDRYRDMPPREFKNITVDEIAIDLSYIFRIYKSLQIPNNFLLFGRAAGLLNGLASRLDPNTNLIELGKPYAKKFIMEGENITSKFTIIKKDLINILHFLPNEIHKLVLKANRGEMKTEMTSEDVTSALLKIQNLGKLTITFIGTITFAIFYIYAKQHGMNIESAVSGIISAVMFIIFFFHLLGKG